MNKRQKETFWLLITMVLVFSSAMTIGTIFQKWLTGILLLVTVFIFSREL